MPLMRAAWPMVAGRNWLNFWRASLRMPSAFGVVEVFRQAALFHALQTADFGFLLLDVGAVLGGHRGLLGHLSIFGQTRAGSSGQSLSGRRRYSATVTVRSGSVQPCAASAAAGVSG